MTAACLDLDPREIALLNGQAARTDIIAVVWSNACMNPAKLRCVVVDSDADFLMRVQRRFVATCTDFEVVPFASSLEAVEFLRRERADLVLTAYLMPQIDGLQLISIVRALRLQVPIYMASHVPIQAAALARGATAFFSKASFWTRLENAVAMLRERRSGFAT